VLVDLDHGRKRSDARKLLDRAPVGRPLEGAGRTRRIAPFVGAAAIAFALVLLLVRGSRTSEVLIAALLVLPLVASSYALPWRRLPTWAQTAPPLIYLAIVALLRDASGADASIFTVPVILPVFWFALYGTRAQLATSLAGLFLVLAAPALIVGAPHYPVRDELVRAFLWLLIAGTAGLTVHRLVLAVRSLAADYRSTLETAHESFISIDGQGRIIEWNRQAEADFGWRREEVIGRPLAETVIPARHRTGHSEAFRRFVETGESHLHGRRLEMEALHRDGSEFPVELTISGVRSETGYTFNAFLHDISERRESERAVREAEERFRRAFDDAAIGMAIVSPGGEWLQVNEALCDLTGLSKQDLRGLTLADVTHPDDLGADLDALRELATGSRRRYLTETRYLRADGEEVWILLGMSAVADGEGRVLHLISQMQDITERKRAEARLAHQAMHDPLTGLPNRSLFNDRILLAKSRLRREHGLLALLFCDLDYFKSVNDELGHEAGDRLLVEAATRLRSVVRPSDTVARFGGDEFVVACEGVDVQTAEAIASRIVEAHSSPFRIEGREISLTTSIGIVLTGEPDFDPDELLGDADVAMYVAKERGRCRHVVFGPQMRHRRLAKAHPPGDPLEPIHAALLSR